MKNPKNKTNENLGHLEIISFALNWHVYKTTEGLFLVGAEDDIFKSFHDVNTAISYMMEQIYG